MTDWKKVEAVLFASGSYMDADRISQLTDIPKKKVLKVLEELKEKYDKFDSSIEVFEDDNSWKLNVKQEYSSLVQKVVSGIEMAKPIMETLALVAYKSPVMQSDIINTRGTVAYEHLSYLEEKKFITREKFGRTYKLKITEKFNDYFDIDDSKIQSLFEEIEKPVAEEYIPVIEETTAQFEEKIIDRMKKQVPHESEEQRDEFLNSFEQKLGGVKERLDTAEKEIADLKPKQEESEKSKEDIEDAFEEDETKKNEY